ncbi:MAG: fibrobacter succinogenes major paralogous domain-containing protein [Saprospiraceae bacterium]|nr:fibrobacter succinogenes major paralogous domain-containing protein [Saprospiraceae bacterium]
MKNGNKFLIGLLVGLIPCTLLGQEQLEVEGAIIIMSSEASSPAPGTMRWTGSDFEGWNGQRWVSLTGYAIAGTVTDIDGNTYQTSRIGDQEWMVENLRVTKYNDNTAIDQITNNATWSGLSTAAWCWYDNDNSYEVPYGKLYNWYAVNSTKLCPTGWHVPSDAEWTTMTDHLGGSSTAGGKMKRAGPLVYPIPEQPTAEWTTMAIIFGGLNVAEAI